MRFQKSQPAGAATLVPHSASTGPLKNMDASSPARKAHAHGIHEKAGSISITCKLPWFHSLTAYHHTQIGLLR